MTSVRGDVTGTLRAGAAKIDITPGAGQLPERFLGVADRIHVRALVVDDGQTHAALVSVDVIGLTTEVWQEVARRVDVEAGVGTDRLLLFASHTHSARASSARGSSRRS